MHVTQKTIEFIKSGMTYEEFRKENITGKWTNEICACGHKSPTTSDSTYSAAKTYICPCDIAGVLSKEDNMYADVTKIDCLACGIALDEALGGRFLSNPVDNLRDASKGR